MEYRKTPTIEMSDTPETDAAAEKCRSYKNLGTDFNGMVGHAKNMERQRNQMRDALLIAARWGIRSDGFSGEVSDSLRTWIDAGMSGDPPKVPSYYPHNDNILP